MNIECIPFLIDRSYPSLRNEKKFPKTKTKTQDYTKKNSNLFDFKANHLRSPNLKGDPFS